MTARTQTMLTAQEEAIVAGDKPLRGSAIDPVLRKIEAIRLDFRGAFTN